MSCMKGSCCGVTEKCIDSSKIALNEECFPWCTQTQPSRVEPAASRGVLNCSVWDGLGWAGLPRKLLSRSNLELLTTRQRCFKVPPRCAAPRYSVLSSLPLRQMAPSAVAWAAAKLLEALSSATETDNPLLIASPPLPPIDICSFAPLWFILYTTHSDLFVSYAAAREEGANV